MIDSDLQFGNTVSRILTGLSLTMEVDNCHIVGKDIKQVITKVEELLIRCCKYDIKLAGWKPLFGCKVLFAWKHLGGKDGTS